MTAISRTSHNIGANFIGNLSSIILAVLFTPVYIHILGIEAYGIIGFYITLQGTISFLEMGLSRVCNRELARLSGEGTVAASQSMLDTLRSLEVIYWLIALLLGLSLSFAAPLIASSWLQPASFPQSDLSDVLILIAWVIALRWPVALYLGAIMGMQRQVLMNVILVAIAALNWGGAALILWLVDSEIHSFFKWQFIVSIISSGAFAIFAWRVMPGSALVGRFSIDRIRDIIPLATGIGGNVLLGMILQQADKLILSAILPLKQFGFYMLASVLANGVAMLANPVSNAVFPRFSQMISGQFPLSSLSSLYHLASQLVCMIIIPFSLMVAFFSHEVLYIYTGDSTIADQAAVVLAILIIAKMLHASLIVPYALQLAYGWVRLSLYVNIVSVFWIIPAVYFLSKWYGMEGASIAWLVATIGSILITVPLMHRRVLVGEWKLWMIHTMGLPLVTAASFLITFNWLFIGVFPDGRWALAGVLSIVGICAFIVTSLSMPLIRSRIFTFVDSKLRLFP